MLTVDSRLLLELLTNSSGSWRSLTATIHRSLSAAAKEAPVWPYNAKNSADSL